MKIFKKNKHKYEKSDLDLSAICVIFQLGIIKFKFHQLYFSYLLFAGINLCSFAIEAGENIDQKADSLV